MNSADTRIKTGRLLEINLWILFRLCLVDETPRGVYSPKIGKIVAYKKDLWLNSEII